MVHAIHIVAYILTVPLLHNGQNTRDGARKEQSPDQRLYAVIVGPAHLRPERPLN